MRAYIEELNLQVVDYPDSQMTGYPVDEEAYSQFVERYGNERLTNRPFWAAV